MWEKTFNFFKDETNQAKMNYGASALAGMANSLIDYNRLKTENAFSKVQASQIELQAQQQMNQLREQFNNSIGNYQYNAAARGVKAGSLNSTLEKSAKNLGQDMNTINTNARFKTDGLRAQARINNKYATAGLLSGIVGSLGSLSNNLSNLSTVSGK